MILNVSVWFRYLLNVILKRSILFTSKVAIEYITYRIYSIPDSTIRRIVL